jgi:hypothetical protein
MISKPTASASSIGGRKPKYATHHEHQKSHLTTPHCNLLKYALFTIRAFLPRPSHLIHPMQGFSTTMALMQWRAEGVQPSGLQNMMDLSDVSTGIPLYGISQYL